MKTEIRKRLTEIGLVAAGVFLYLFYVIGTSLHMENGVRLMEMQNSMPDGQAVLRQMRMGEILTRTCDLYALSAAAVLFAGVLRKRPVLILCHGICSMILPVLILAFTGKYSFHVLEPILYCGKYGLLYLFAVLTAAAGVLAGKARHPDG